MDIINRIRPLAVTTATVVALGISSTAMACADRAIEACKSAIADEQGAELSTRLKKIKTRGGGYEAWFNLSDGDQQMKAFCATKRDQVELVTSEGSWTGRNPRRPEM